MDLDGGPFYSKLDLKKIKLLNFAFALYFLSKRNPTFRIFPNALCEMQSIAQ